MLSVAFHEIKADFHLSTSKFMNEIQNFSSFKLIIEKCVKVSFIDFTLNIVRSYKVIFFYINFRPMNTYNKKTIEICRYQCKLCYSIFFISIVL